MFDKLRLVVNHPLVLARIRQTLIAFFLIVLSVIVLAVVQFKTGKWPFERYSEPVAKNYNWGNKQEVLESVLDKGEVDTLLRALGDKQFDWESTIAELAQDVEDRRKIALRIMELPSTKPYELDIARNSLIRALIDRETILRKSDSVDSEYTKELRQFTEMYANENEQLTRVCAASSSVLAIGSLLDANSDSDEIEGLLNDAVQKLGQAAALYRDDKNIAKTHFFWIDWVRSHLGDKKSLPLIETLREHYLESKTASIRRKMRRVLQSIDRTSE